MLDSNRILALVKEKGAKSVGLQFPEGLKREILDVADTLQREGFEVVLNADPCFGACDISPMPCDLLIHFGHASLGMPDKENVVFEEVQVDCSLAVLERCIPLLKNPVGLVTNVQHVFQIPEIKEFLEKREFNVKVGQGDKRVPYEGQILGCNFSSARVLAGYVKSFLYFGTGTFHPLGIGLATNVDVIAADPFTKDVRTIAELKDKFMKQRFAAIELASTADRIGILVSKKSGQKRPDLAKRLRDDLAKSNKKGYILYLDNIIAENLEGYGFDAFVSTACPRIAIDDYMRFKKPIVNPKELEIVLGKRSWDDYEIDEF
ncbi:MAG: diphthamide biosynthesis enzyme Dph2 [Thermoplasmata archaeon]|nr:diphthamide biosynthesis enzyme Dph2 [Thermoplasmata archaeon]